MSNATRSRNWCFTLNNYGVDDVGTIGAMAHRYCIIGREVGENGTPHLQGFMCFKNQRKFDQVQKLFKPLKPHIERARGDIDSNIIYCSKEGDVMEFGTRPASAIEKGVLERARWVDAWDMAKAGRFETIDPRISIPYIRNLEHLYNRSRAAEPLADLDILEHEWHWGVTGAGKSFGVRRDNPVFYLKPLNKWWDGYDHEDVVLIEEVDPSHAMKFGAMLKTWCDHYPFRAEVKSSTIYIRPRKIIITSNYPIKVVFPDAMMHEPLLRRFKVHHYAEPFRRVRQIMPVLQRVNVDAAVATEAVAIEPVADDDDRGLIKLLIDNS